MSYTASFMPSSGCLCFFSKRFNNLRICPGALFFPVDGAVLSQQIGQLFCDGDQPVMLIKILDDFLIGQRSVEQAKSRTYPEL